MKLSAVLLFIVVVVALLSAACGGDENATTATESTAVTTAATTTTTTTEATTTTPAAATTKPTTTMPATTEPAPERASNFEITRVDFGGDGFVEVTNTGTAVGTTEGLWLCQFPTYSPLPDVVLEPGESVWVTRGDEEGLIASGEPVQVVPDAAYGPLVAETGEMGLYVSTNFNVNFSSPGAIISYVEWGDSGHARSSVAVNAGIWPEGGFVDVADADTIGTAVAEPADPADWQAG